MVIVMEISTGAPIREPEAYDEEVLNASWLPCPELGLQLQPVEETARAERKPLPPEDVDAFLRAVYRYQE